MNQIFKINIRLYLFYVTVLLMTIGMSCKKLVEVDSPTTSTNSNIVFSIDATAIAAVTDIYIKMSQSGVSGRSILNPSLFAGLSADELTLYGGITDLGLRAYYENNLTTSISALPDYWQPAYNLIYVCNAAIEGLSSSTKLKPGIKEQLIGEAKFIRAFTYFYLINLYGNVPLNTTSNYKLNSVQQRTEKTLVYQQIIEDLLSAQELLKAEYLNSSMSFTEDRTRPNKYAAMALLARVYLYIGNYANAEIEATKVINHTEVYDTVPLDHVFLKNSKETIWALQPVSTGTSANTSEGKTFILSANPSNSFPVFLSNHLINGFDVEDQRRIRWVGQYTDVDSDPDVDYFFAYKYKIRGINTPTQEYSVILRLAEQYLIRAEARAHLGNTEDANDDLNVIRARAGLSNTTLQEGPALLNAILTERRLELFTEWGHRWLDLKRTGKTTEVLQPIKGVDWQESDELYPIPLIELERNPGIKGNQNPGYQ